MDWFFYSLAIQMSALIAVILLRGWAAYEVASRTLGQRLNARSWMLLPLQDLIGFCLWVAGFQGNTILWRGRQYRLLSDGRFELLRP